jgi:hypothetical protein
MRTTRFLPDRVLRSSYMEKRRPTSIALGLVVAASGVVAGLASPAGRAVGLPTITITTPLVTTTTPTVPVPPVTTSPVPPPPTVPVTTAVPAPTVPAPTVPAPTVPVRTVPAPTVTAPAPAPKPPPVPVPKPAPVPVPKAAPATPTPKPSVAVPVVTTPASAPSHAAPLPATPISPQAPRNQQQTASGSSPGTAAASQSASPSAGGSGQVNTASASSASRGAAVSPAASKSAVRSQVRSHSSRASSLRLTSVTDHHGRTRSVYLVLRVAQHSRVHLTLIGPTPSCLTARKLTRRLHPGVNRLKLGPAQVHGLQNGRYIVRVPVAGRPKPFLTAVKIVAGHRVLPGRGRARLPQACFAAPPASTSSSASANTGARSSSSADPQATATPLAQPAEHGFSPKAISRVARGAGHAAESAVQTTGNFALAHLLIVVFISLLVLGGWAIIFPLVRLVHPPKHP